MAKQMPEISCNVPIPTTPQELEQAIQRYKTEDLHGTDLFCQWQAIRMAAIAQTTADPIWDAVAGEDSY